MLTGLHSGRRCCASYDVVVFEKSSTASEGRAVAYRETTADGSAWCDSSHRIHHMSATSLAMGWYCLSVVKLESVWMLDWVCAAPDHFPYLAGSRPSKVSLQRC